MLILNYSYKDFPSGSGSTAKTFSILSQSCLSGSVSVTSSIPPDNREYLIGYTESNFNYFTAFTVTPTYCQIAYSLTVVSPTPGDQTYFVLDSHALMITYYSTDLDE